MKETSKWLLQKEASKVLGVTEKTLEIFREQGLLQPGTHWKSSSDPDQLPWKPKVSYQIKWCRDAIEHYARTNALSGQIAA